VVANKVQDTIPSHRLSVAPMMDWTDRHFRWLMRHITRETLLYTEMVTTGAILRSKDRDRYLAFSPLEGPIALQLGGDDPKALADCALIGEEYGYNEINLNVGCPSDRVKSGSFGACLMKEPALVADMVNAMKASTRLPVTVKHRIGVNGKESLEDLIQFVETISQAGVDGIIIHARIAILEGLSPAENRKIPPLRYSDVYEVKRFFPNLPVVINGGITNFEDAKQHLAHVDGVMLGRAAYENPYLFANADSIFFEKEDQKLSRADVLRHLKEYCKGMESQGVKLHHVMRHALGLYHGQHGARAFRRFFSEKMHAVSANVSLIDMFLGKG
jgi:tRNA-dihydrouridine synthase A